MRNQTNTNQPSTLILAARAAHFKWDEAAKEAARMMRVRDGDVNAANKACDEAWAQWQHACNEVIAAFRAGRLSASEFYPFIQRG